MKMPLHIKPMLAKPGPLPRDWENWGFEFKWDGIRAITYWDATAIRIESRNLLDITFRYPELAELGTRLGKSAIVDGEIVALDAGGRPSFPLLQKRMLVRKDKFSESLKKIRIVYYVFDLLFLNGNSLMGRPYYERRRVLEGLGIDHFSYRVPPLYAGMGTTALEIAKRHGLEGIVCKRLGSVYSPDSRSSDWTKVKLVRADEFIIGGFKYVRDTRSMIGSLQLGIYDHNRELKFVGGVGTGFSAIDHRFLLDKLEAEKTADNPFAESIGKDVVFVRPKYVAEIEYRRWPKNGMLQQASYKGLRTDKSPDKIILRK